MDGHVKVLLQQLERFERVSARARASWLETQSSGAESTETIFFNAGGFTAWLAYYLTKNAAEKTNHFVGKVDCVNLVALLERESVDFRREIATRLRSEVGSEIQQKVDRTHDRLAQHPKDPMALQQRNKRRRTDDGQTCSMNGISSHSSAPSPTALQSNANTQLPPLNQVEASSLDDSYLALHDHVLVNASLRSSTSLMPTYLAGAIERVRDPNDEDALIAGISMTFPNEPFTNKIGCTMSINVTANKVQGLAKELFDANLETDRGFRYLLLPNGSRVLPNLNFSLQGCQHSARCAVFGRELSDGIAASPQCQDDIKQGRDYTDSVSMMISHDADQGGTICVMLGLKEGSVIRDKLYR